MILFQNTFTPKIQIQNVIVLLSVHFKQNAFENIFTKWKLHVYDESL